MIFNSIIPLPYYTPLFYNVLLVIIILAFIRLQTNGYVIQNVNKKETASLVLLIVVTLYMGLRPISGRYFGDMRTYYNYFNQYATGADIRMSKDILWDLFMKLSSSIMSAQLFFLLCAVLYIVPLYSAVKKWFGVDKYFIFLMLLASFSFWSYGTNGIRNGIATSLFVLGVSYTNSKYWKYGFFVMAYFVHGSMLIPIAAYILTVFYKNSKHYLVGWLLSIPLSLVFGGAIESLIMSIGLGGERTGYLTMQGFEDQFSSTGFRWDFLLYSAAAVFAGYYFIIKRGFNDTVYMQLFNMYVTANAFWILVIRAAFSNRFAYLSWFLMAIVIFYPFFKQQFFVKQQKVLAYTVLVYYGFTYFMTTIL
ncbi:EpsG family protein [Lutibacter sp. A64]|uniref:EpsG family protein n=1 Tax=Lutibacter sp. A64 TaxID=2918526 RepID=UPI001F05FC39|nr:EpsG family protein [Lutibacter sp. A64]UMB55462.1 EpsG family protein [Lutibacter sp. A64]